MNNKNQLKQSATIIKDEVRLGANTATRIGTMFLQLIDALVDHEEMGVAYLSKTKADIAKELITFLNGISVGSNNEASITADGNGYFKNLKVDGSLDVFELKYNQQQAVRGDLFFTDSATIKRVEPTGDNAYYITFDASEFDLLQFQEHDVLRGSVRTPSGGKKQSWLRVTRTDAANNAVSVIAYPSDEVPNGHNDIPTEKMVLAHWGNAVKKERQRTWYLSNTEGRFVLLDGVTKPIIEDRNEAAYIGLPTRRKSWEGLPINYDQPIVYARTGIFENTLKVDYEGVITPTIVDTGVWISNKKYSNGQQPPHIQHDVWHIGCRWRCIVDTESEPSLTSTSWVLLSGDTNLAMDLISERNFIYINGDVNDKITASVFMGQMNVTTEILDKDWSWTRDSGNADKDTIWNEQHKGLTNVLELKQSDVSDTEGIISITCTAYYRDGKDISKTEYSIEL